MTGTKNQKIKYKALSYIIFGNELFKKKSKGVLFKHLSESKFYLEIFSGHSGSCGITQTT